MNYTQQRRRAMNKAVRALYPDIDFYESPNGVPVMECVKLPEGAVRVTDADDFLREVKEHCTRTNDIGLHTTDFSKALPVFIRSMELMERDTRHFYRVNYVSMSELSQRKAAEYIADGKLYAVVNQDTCNP